MTIKCIVAAINSDGVADLYFVKVECTKDQFNDDKHRAAARRSARDEGYEPRLVFDESDPGGKAMLPLFVWDSASVVPCSAIKCE